jgi:hypothetical protein
MGRSSESSDFLTPNSLVPKAGIEIIFNLLEKLVQDFTLRPAPFSL